MVDALASPDEVGSQITCTHLMKQTKKLKIKGLISVACFNPEENRTFDADPP